MGVKTEIAWTDHRPEPQPKPIIKDRRQLDLVAAVNKAKREAAAAARKARK
jgi:hypothetical protein